MTSFWHELARYTRTFASNWTTSEAPTSTKVRMLGRNRLRSLTNRGCCGHHGEPGC